MHRSTLGGGFVVVVVATLLGGLTASLVTANELFLGSGMTTAALASLAVVILGLCAFAVLGRPWRRWARTPYW